MNRDAVRTPNALLDRAKLKEMNVRLEERRRERARIASELHDTLFQDVLGACLQLCQAAEQVPADSPGKPGLSRALRLLQRAIDEGRNLLQGLRPSGIATLSLEQALSGVRDDFDPGDGPQFRMQLTGQPRPLNSAVQEQIYLIGREALSNALRHSRATSIEAEVEYLPRRLRIIIRDNGCGIDERVLRSGRQGHWGLIGMRERAGSIGATFRIWSRPGAGTEMEVCVPGDVAFESRAEAVA